MFPRLKEEQRTALKGFHHLYLTLARVWSDAVVFHRWWCASGISPHTSSCSEEFWLAGFEWQRQKSRPVIFQFLFFFVKTVSTFPNVSAWPLPRRDLSKGFEKHSIWWVRLVVFMLKVSRTADEIMTMITVFWPSLQHGEEICFYIFRFLMKYYFQMTQFYTLAWRCKLKIKIKKMSNCSKSSEI